MKKGEKRDLKKTENINTGREDALKTALKAIHKEFGDGAIYRLGDKPKQNILAHSTGSIIKNMEQIHRLHSLS